MTTLATTGTFGFAPSIGECALNALSRIRIRGPMVKAEHLHQAMLEANLLQVEWSNRGPNLWTVDEISVPLVEGQSTYTVPPETIMILDVTRGFGDPEQEISMSAISRSEYMAYPVKSQPGPPSVYWFDRLIAPTITVWPVPDNDNYTLHYYRYRQQMDAQIASAANFEAPYRWLDAACAGLAYRLSVHYAQDLEDRRKAQYDQAYGFAAKQDVDSGHLFISPMIEFYYG